MDWLKRMCFKKEAAEEKELRKINAKIDKEIKMEWKMRKKEVKILLLGPGESGKSTIFKQMKIIHMNGFSKDDLLNAKATIYGNTTQCITNICKAMVKLNIPYELDSSQEEADKIINIPLLTRVDEDLFQMVGSATKKLLKDPGVKNCLERSREFYLPDSAPYFFENLDRFLEADFMPTEQDALRIRIKTTGISEIHFNMGNIPIHMVDVGGQRSERKKWIHCFENVTTLIFFVALSCYNQQLAEDRGQNRMLETLILFNSIVNSQWFRSSSIILFLNMTDLFREKLPKYPLEYYFPAYKGGNDFEKAATFIYERFQELNTSKLQIYPHLTCATDTENVKFVFSAVKETVLQNNLKHAGFL